MRFAAGLMAGALGVGLTAANGQAWGQIVEAPEGAGEIVVVTGIGPARSSDELIASSTVLDTSDVVERLSGGLGDTLSGLPGVASTSFGPGASRPIIRGLGAERVQVLANGIGVIDASAASPDHAVTSDPLGVERIEILRGPAALAYGGGATGGVVNVIDGLIVDTLPEEAFSGAAYGSLTSVDDGKQAAGRIVGRMGPVVGVLNGSWLDANDIDIPGFAFSEARQAEEIANGADPADFANGTLPNSFVENQSISAGLSWVGDEAFLGAAVRDLENSYGIIVEEEAFIEMSQTRYDVRGGLRFDGPIRSLKGWGSVVDYEHTEFEDPVTPGTVFTNEGWEGRIELGHASFAGLEGSIGVQASDRDFAAVGAEALIGPTETRQTGVFGYETYDRGGWGLEGGLRFDDVEVDNVAGGARSFEAWNASFGAHVHVGGNLFLGGSIARTERAPTDVELFADGPHLATGQFEVGDDTLETEEGVNLELTARWEGQAVNISGSVYRFDFDSFVFLEDTGAIDTGDPLDPEDDLPIFQYVQAGAVFTGFEVSGDTRLGSAFGVDWQADGSIDFVRAEVDAGGNLPLIPPMMINAGLEGRRDGITGRLELQYGAEQDDIAAFETPTGDYLTLDARLGIDLTDTVRLVLEGKNLSDEEVRVHSSPLKEIAPLAGRNFRVALRAEF
jgi:iron complex outermembrane recepter protein